MGRDGVPREISTRNAAAIDLFHGGDPESVEDAFVPLEGRGREIFDAMDKGASPSAFSKDLRRFVWMLSVRTSAFREHAARAIGLFLDEMAREAHSPEAERAFRENLRAQRDAIVQKIVSELPAGQRRTVEKFFRTAGGRRLLRRELKRAESADFGAFFNLFTEALQDEDRLRASVATGQIGALRQLLSTSLVPDSFCPQRWEVVEDPSSGMILGDGCVVALSDTGSSGSLLRFATNWNELYLPLSPSQVLVASRGPDRWMHDTDELNRMSAENSHSFIYASEGEQRAVELAARIGTGDAFSSREEIIEAAHRIWEELSPSVQPRPGEG